jgi:hypothetical protein
MNGAERAWREWLSTQMFLIGNQKLYSESRYPTQWQAFDNEWGTSLLHDNLALASLHYRDNGKPSSWGTHIRSWHRTSP